MIRLLTAASLIALAATPLAAHDTTADREALERDVRILADDNMEGREAGTRGYAAAAGYVAGRFAALGLEPGGDNDTYFQAVPMRKYGDARDPVVTITKGRETIRPEAFVEFYGGGGSQVEKGVVEGDLVFIGYGLDLPERGRNDFDGVDLNGKIAVRAYGAPGYLNTEERAHLRSTIGKRLSERGAIGSILLWTPQINKIINFENASKSARGDSSMTWLDAEGNAYTSAPNLRGSAVLSPEISRQLLAGEDFDYDALVEAEQAEDPQIPSFAMGARATIDFESTFEAITSNNVIAILPGTDPALANQYVVLTGHLDHEGIKETPEQGDDEIYNGAMDNATGIASMIEVARLLKGNPPRRPVMFVALTAEEKGLVGSEYHAANPIVPKEHIAVNLNLDMPIVTYPFTDVNAFGAERSNVFPHVKAAVEAAGLTLSPDPEPEQGLFVRSDQYSYVKQGVPAIYLKTGFAGVGREAQTAFRTQHYHQASDEADLVDYEQLGRFTEVNYQIADAVANMDERPAWLPGDFFGTTFNGPIVGAE